MAKISLAAFRDPRRRPRAIIWTGVAVFAFAAFFMVVGIIGTSTRLFCGQVCHKVQDDTIVSYERSTHSEISCMACHEPVNADPVTFLLAKAKSAGELVLTVSNNFELPLNADSALAMNAKEMGSKQCTQCHSTNRKVSPSRGIIIDHKVHADKSVTCTTCHNRVAHNETGMKFKLAGNRAHQDFMKMTACFRCHALKGGSAPGTCSACHPPSFKLKPANHSQPGFYQRFGDSKGHAKLALEDEARLAELKSEEASAAAAGVKEEASGGPAMVKPSEVSYCGTCHDKTTFCTACHGVEMPHPKDFLKTHGPLGTSKPAVCANCHAKSKESATTLSFCSTCHHQGSDPNRPWLDQHWQVVRDKGANGCFQCHNPTFCSNCHVRGAITTP
jgi:nitrate/TMAO reductase-like tetraheme cytochrome c subunit